MAALDRIKRAAAAWVLQAAGRARANRRRFYQGATGLRILTFHRVPPAQVASFRSIVRWCARRFDLAGPEDADRVAEGTFRQDPRDRVLLTFDDGHQEDHAQARWLAEQGIRAVFFVIPSYVDRTVSEFMRYHAERGVAAYDIAQERPHETARGLTRGQLAEMAAMGHRIAAHNFAHRDLGRLRDPKDLDYEIGHALEGIEALLGRPCEDFAWSFGNPAHLSDEAAAYLRRRCRRVYSSVRGLNLGDRPRSFLLRDAIDPGGSAVLARLLAAGGGDDRWVEARRSLKRLEPPPPGA